MFARAARGGRTSNDDDALIECYYVRDIRVHDRGGSSYCDDLYNDAWRSRESPVITRGSRVRYDDAGRVPGCNVIRITICITCRCKRSRERSGIPLPRCKEKRS